MLSLRQHLTLPVLVDILLDGRIYIQRSTRSFLDCASEFSSASYQGKSTIQVVFTKGVGLVIVTDAAFPLEEISHNSELKQREQMQLFRQEKLLHLELNGISHGKSALTKAVLLKSGESTVFVKTIQVTAV
jgi:hypothetical protein